MAVQDTIEDLGDQQRLSHPGGGHSQPQRDGDHHRSSERAAERPDPRSGQPQPRPRRLILGIRRGRAAVRRRRGAAAAHSVGCSRVFLASFGAVVAANGSTVRLAPYFSSKWKNR